MKITDIKCYVLESKAAPPRFRWRAGLPGDGDGTPPGEPTYTALIKVETDEGIAGMAQARRGYYVADVVRRRLKNLIGLNPLLTERLWHEVWEG